MSSSIVSPINASSISPTNNNNTNGNNHNSNNTNNSGNQKSETQYGGNATSPCYSDGNNSQTLDDSNAKNKNNSLNSSVNLNTLDNPSRAERDSLPNITSNSLMRPGSGSCSQQFNETSPNNGDSSSNGSNISHLNNDNCKTNDEEILNKNQAIKSNMAIKKEDRENSNSILCTSSSSASSSNNTSLTTQAAISTLKVALASSASVKDEKDLIKKEETSLSPPNMSPVGFGTFVGTQNNECNENTHSAANKLNDSSSSCDKRSGMSGNVFNENDDAPVAQAASGQHVSGPGTNLNLSGCNTLNPNTNTLNSKPSTDGLCSDGSTSTPLGSNNSNTICNIPLNASFVSNNLTNANGPQQGGGGSNLISGAGNGVSNCMEYMQQQNHIFVFSTQLANKGAEAVLGGLFPTIIAYHCTQPATKSFFEDFFLKNPMKMPKLQRQNTLNIMGDMQPGVEPVAGGQPPWLSNIINPMGKMTHKLALNKAETITSSTTSSGVINENDMIGWDQTRTAIEGGSSGDSSNPMKILENDGSNNTSNKTICSGLSNDDISGIPSLQGVKVPDENLTPQQRQHREEQLAKLKKMNQFLFPENGGANDFHAASNNPMMVGKMQIPPEVLNIGMPGNQVALINMQSPGLGNKLNPAAMRNISGNLLNHSKSGSGNSQLENIPSSGEDVIMPADMMPGPGCGSNEMGVIPAHKQGCLQNISNPGGLGVCGSGLMNTGGNNLSVMGNSGPCGMPPGSLINDANNTMMGNSSDVLSPFHSNHCPSTGQEAGVIMGSHKNMNVPPQTDINTSVGMSQIEWSKLHHHIYEERLKNHHTSANIPPEIGVGPIGCQQTPSLTRSNSTGIGGGSKSLRTSTNLSSSNRGNQGPPPPYHPTQRSASVPIATQSPNPSSPNNPTSNMSLPSPRASNTLSGLSLTTSPNSHMDVASSSVSSTNTTSTTTTTESVGGTSSGSVSANKSIYAQEGSPTPGSCNTARNRSNVNNLNSNPTTPLSHVSPKDIDSMNLNTTPTADHKSTRPSPQRSRSPLLNDVSSNNMELRYPSPGLNFPPGGISGGNSQNLANSFKSQNSNLERPNLQQLPSQLCRRTDNLPLNPNSNRTNQNKMANSFDPISSLAQMSQQLTGCGVGFNSGGVGNSPNNMPGLMGGPGVNEINMDSMMGGPVMGPVDPNIDHCNQNPNGGNMGMSGLGGPVPGSFGPGNCNMMGGTAGPICQRLLNSKMCGPNMTGGFNANQVGGAGMRESPSGFPGMMPSHRMINHRMSANFGNFNVSPNIQVKASTPNTIQYMPVRPQNNNSNVRVPPSLEFLQRYANPQMMGNSIGGLGTGPGPLPSDMAPSNAPSDLNKMQNINNMGVNPNAMNQMNFYGNCNRMSAMGGMGQSLSGEQDELHGMMSNHDPMNIPGPHAPMLRGMRPIRQPGLQPGVGLNSGSRMQHPGMSSTIPPPNNLGGNPFPANDNETLGCNDPTNLNMFNNPAPGGLYQQQKNNKLAAMGVNHGSANINLNNSNNSALSNNNLINDQNPSSNPLQNSVMISGPNNSMLNSNIPGGNAGPDIMGYKHFVGPTSNDLKYAQQYHSFQQQLYATTTRNQQPVVGQQQSSIVMSPNSNPNAGFFVNK